MRVGVPRRAQQVFVRSRRALSTRMVGCARGFSSARVYARLCDRMGFLRSRCRERAVALSRWWCSIFSPVSRDESLSMSLVVVLLVVIRGRALDDFSLLAIGNAYLPKRLFPLVFTNKTTHRETSN